TRLAGKKLPFPGGFDRDGNVTDDPGAIEESMRIMPMGYWKGSSFAFMLDILGSVLTDGVGAADMNAATMGSCGGCSQVMIVVDPRRTMDSGKMEDTIRRALDYVKSAEPAEHGSGVHAPGEGCERFHREHDEQGIFVDDTVWAEILAL
ncbi:MAG: Ldh family oxidoreductase, partial [Clostridia bacterium]|nr:Ldh family oxidoreductase [Clostridia bacterium]